MAVQCVAVLVSALKLHLAFIHRWYRSVVRGGAVCWIHQDREATIQCVLCLRCKVEVRKSFHCSADCLRQQWGLHKDLHDQSRATGGGQLAKAFCKRGREVARRFFQAFVLRPGLCAVQGENGYAHDSSLRGGKTFSNGGETWIEVGCVDLD
jgi:hypothetical protein